MKLLQSFVVVSVFQFAAFAADPGLLGLVMPDAKVVAGIQADQTRNSPFGQYILSRITATGVDLNNFIAETGFDPRRDISEVIVANNGQQLGAQRHGLILAKGVFNVPSMTAAIQAHGGTLTSFIGVNILTSPAHPKGQPAQAIAFLDSSTAVMGDMALVQGAIQQRKANTPASTSLLDKVAQVSLNNDFWFVTLTPISQFAAVLPDPNLRTAFTGNVLAAINQLSGSVRFGSTVTLTVEAVARTDKDAQSLADVLKFAASLAQLNAQKNPQAAQTAGLLNTLDSRTVGNTTTLSLDLPEQQLEQLLASLGPETRRHQVTPPRRPRKQALLTSNLASGA